MSIGDTIKAHPYMIGGGAIGLVVLFMMLHNAGGSSATDAGGSATSGVGAGDQLQQAQLQMQMILAQGQQASDAQAEHDSVALEMAKLQAALQGDANTLNANVASEQIAATLQALTTHDTLQAQTEQNQQNNSTAQLSIAMNTQLQTTQSMMQAFMHQSDLQAQTQMHISDNNKPTCGFFCKIFG
jgi:hypothetical protein